MKVLHLVASPTMTGPADPALGLARAERRWRGLDSRIACDRLRAGNLLEKARDAAVPIVDGLRLSTKGGTFDALADRRVLQNLARDFDVVHAHMSHDHALAVAAQGKAIVIRTIHHPRSLGRRGLQGLAYRRTDGLVTITEAHRAKLLENYPRLDASRVEVLHGAVDADRFTPGTADGRRALRFAERIPERAFVVGMVSRIKPGRRHDRLLEAFALAREKERGRRELFLALIGKGEGESQVRALADRLGIADATRFYGFRDADLPEAIASCDVTVLLSEGNDAGCRAVLESLACAVPVIGGRHAAIEDALGGEAGGLLVDPDDPEPIAAAIQAVAAMEPARYEAFRRHGRVRMLEDYSEQVWAERAAAFYERILARGPAR